MITILFLSANPAETKPLELIKECNIINDKIRASAGGRALFKLEQRHDISIKSLIEELLNYNPQILHFSGHGSEKSALIFKNENTGQIEEVPPTALSDLFKVFGKKIDLVFLNACYSEKQAKAIAEHVNCVIGMSDAIPDITAIEFASIFYLSLGFNKSVKEAFDLAIVQLGLLSMSGDKIPKLIVKEGVDPSKITAVIIGSNIEVEEGINVTTVIQEIKSFGLNFLLPNYFKLYKSLQKDFVDWKKGFPFKLQNIMDEFHFPRSEIINDIISKLDDNNGDHALLLLGKSGSSKSILLMDIMCHYFKKDFIVFYNYGEEEIKDVYALENSLRNRLSEGNKILIAVDNVHDKKTAAIFSIIDSLRSYEEKKDNIRFILTGRQPEFDRFVNDRLYTVPEPINLAIRRLHQQIRYPVDNFQPEEIQDFLKRYKDENEVRDFINRYWYSIFFEYKHEIELKNFIFEKTRGNTILIKFLVFGEGLATDVITRFNNYLKQEELKLQTMLVCSILDIANISITYDLLEGLNMTDSASKLTDETLTFLENENRWRTIHPKWNLELLAYLYNVKDYATLENRKNLLRNALELLMNNLSNEHDRFSILASLYDSTTIDTEENKKFPITVIESVVTNKNNLIHNYLTKDSRYNLYSYYIAKNYYYSQLYDKSLAAIEEALKIYSDGVNSFLNKSDILVHLGRYEEAIKCYDEIITKLDPKKVDAWYNKGSALDKLGKYNEAIQCYNEVTGRLDPSYVNAWYNKGVALDKLGQTVEAIKCYDEIITKLDPKAVDAWYNKGITLGKLGQTEKAIECYDEIITKLDPKYVYAWNNKGNALGNLGKYEEAIKCYDEIITKLDPKYVYAWYNKVLILGNLGKYEEAIKCYDEIITKLYPKNVNALNNKGWILNKLRRYQEAIECYDKALEIDSNVRYLLDNKGVTLINLGKYEEAIEYFDKALKIDPNHTDALEHKKIAEEKLKLQ